MVREEWPVAYGSSAAKDRAAGRRPAHLWCVDAGQQTSSLPSSDFSSKRPAGSLYISFSKERWITYVVVQTLFYLCLTRCLMKILANITIDGKLQPVVVFLGNDERSIRWILQDSMQLWWGFVMSLSCFLTFPFLFVLSFWCVTSTCSFCRCGSTISWNIAWASYIRLIGLCRYSLFSDTILLYCLFYVLDVFFVQVLHCYPPWCRMFPWFYLPREADGFWTGVGSIIEVCSGDCGVCLHWNIMVRYKLCS
jgi:hypothetical protein